MPIPINGCVCLLGIAALLFVVYLIASLGGGIINRNKD